SALKRICSAIGKRSQDIVLLFSPATEQGNRDLWIIGKKEKFFSGKTLFHLLQLILLKRFRFLKKSGKSFHISPFQRIDSNRDLTEPKEYLQSICIVHNIASSKKKTYTQASVPHSDFFP